MSELRKELRCFFEKLFTEPEFRQIFASTKSAREGYELAKPYLKETTVEEFKDGISYVHEKLYDKHYKEMSEFDLENISGGVKDEFVSIVGFLNNLNDYM